MSQVNIGIYNSNDQINRIFADINHGIKDIDDILNNVNKAVLTLNDKKWNTKEKRKMEQELMPYLDIMSKKYYNYLNYRLNFVKKAVQDHLDNDSGLKQEVEDKLVA